jgi:ABC-type transport system involved in multi-copper enzyme maturation permease subunit
MKSVLIIAQNTFKEIIRDRILYGIIIFAVLLFGISVALGQLSFTEQSRISADLGFTAIHLGAVILSIFVGSTLVGREIEKKTILTLLVRPITRSQFVVGKTLGLLSVIWVCVFGLAICLAGLLHFIGMPPNTSFLVGLLGVMLEACVLLSLTTFFGSFSSPTLSVSFVIGIFLIGHWVESLKYFTSKSESLGFQLFGKFIAGTMPNLEIFNWRSLFIYLDPVPWTEVGLASLYMLAWVLLLISMTTIILGKRDLG